MLNFDLSPKQLEVQQKAREFALKVVMPIAWYYDEKDEIPLSVLRRAYDEGLMNNDTPKKYGGNEYGILEGVIMTEEISAACPGLATSTMDKIRPRNVPIAFFLKPLLKKYGRLNNDVSTKISYC
jgi:acyl-CoA dehydrogenase